MTSTFTTSGGVSFIVDDQQIAEKLRRIERAVANDGLIDLKIEKRDGKLRQVIVSVIFRVRGEA